MSDGFPTITDCAHVTVTTGKVSVALTRAELDLVLGGNAGMVVYGAFRWITNR